MIINENDIIDPQNDFFGESKPNESENNFDEEDDELAEFIYEEGDINEIILKAIFISKPLGIIWDDDLIIDFLKAKGYKIIDRVNEETDEVFQVAVLPGSKLIPDSRDNLRKTFDREIQKTLLKWLLKIDKE